MNLKYFYKEGCAPESIDEIIKLCLKGEMQRSDLIRAVGCNDPVTVEHAACMGDVLKKSKKAKTIGDIVEALSWIVLFLGILLSIFSITKDTFIISACCFIGAFISAVLMQALACIVIALDDIRKSLNR